VKARPAAGFGVSYSHWIPGRAAAGQLGFRARDWASHTAAVRCAGLLLLDLGSIAQREW